MLVGALRAFVNTHCLRIAISEFGGGRGCGAASAVTLPPVVQNELVTITPVLLQAAASEQQVGARALVCGPLSMEPGQSTVGGLAPTGIESMMKMVSMNVVCQDFFLFAYHTRRQGRSGTRCWLSLCS